jgi:hypothetical protein
MKVTIEELPKLRVAYFRNVGEYGEKQNKEQLESFKKWAQFLLLKGNVVMLNKDFNVENQLKFVWRIDRFIHMH